MHVFVLYAESLNLKCLLAFLQTADLRSATGNNLQLWASGFLVVNVSVRQFGMNWVLSAASPGACERSTMRVQLGLATVSYI